jgi:hypothetical protein
LFVVGASGDLNGGGQPGGAPDAVWQDAIGAFTLTDGGDTISLLDADGNLVASANYEDGNVFGAGVAHELAIGNAHANGQTTDAHTIAATTPFGTDFGSPGRRGDTEFPLVTPALSTAISGLGPDFSITFPSTSAVTYTLWSSPNLGTWQPFGGMPPLIGDGGPGVFTFPLPGDDRFFYQIQLRYAAPD